MRIGIILLNIRLDMLFERVALLHGMKIYKYVLLVLIFSEAAILSQRINIQCWDSVRLKNVTQKNKFVSNYFHAAVR